jgi:FOG: LysM repeat
VSLRPERTAVTGPVAVLGTIALSLSPSATPAAASTSSASTTTLKAVPAATPKPVPSKAKKKTRTHTVVRGDTVSAIAARHGLRTADVLAWNGLRWKSIIHPGDVLRLSAPAAKSAHSAASPAKKSSSASPKTGAATHTVVRGDTLWAIARHHGVSLRELLHANDLSTAAIIYPGEKLRIPGAAAAAPAPDKTSDAKGPAGPKKTSAAPASAPTVTLDAEQIKNVKLIISVGRELGVPRKGIAIALATAMVESGIRNVDHGTYDSLGIFQQRPSTGWGTRSQVREARRSAAAFFGGPRIRTARRRAASSTSRAGATWLSATPHRPCRSRPIHTATRCGRTRPTPG